MTAIYETSLVRYDDLRSVRSLTQRLGLGFWLGRGNGESMRLPRLMIAALGLFAAACADPTLSPRRPMTNVEVFDEVWQEMTSAIRCSR